MRFQGREIYIPSPPTPEEPHFFHRVLIEGVIKDPVTGQDCFSIINSWGRKWAFFGFGRLPATLFFDICYPVGVGLAKVAAAPPGLVTAPSSAGLLEHPPDDLPKAVVRNLRTKSIVMSMDFHPKQPTVLLVGTNIGDISIYEVGSEEKIAGVTFLVWGLSNSSCHFRTTLEKDPTISVNRCVWSPDGSVFGVAFSKYIVQIHKYYPVGEIESLFEIEAHIGGVNDIAFAYHNKLLCIVTCGDDKIIKVWEALTGIEQYTFEGHEAPVYSVCPHYKENFLFIFSTAKDRKIKLWRCDSLESRVVCDDPGLWYTTIAYSADGVRLFSCGTSEDGESHLVEWNESEGSIKRTFSGFLESSSGVVQFDTTKNRYLAAGDEFLIKYWNMDNTSMLACTDAGGGLHASPRLRFNKEGSLLAVSTRDSSIKILATNDGQRMLDSRRFDPEPVMVDSSDELKALKLPDHHPPSKVVQLLYTNSGSAVLALCSNAVHKLWKWQRDERNPSGKSSAVSIPQLWQPTIGASMSNDRNDSKSSEDSVACIALSKNDSYVISASGGNVSLFNMMTFEVVTTFMPPPPGATYLAFHPQDSNIIAVGMEDSSIRIYNVRDDEVKTELKGHQNRVSGLAFSLNLNILASSGADALLCIWSIDGWEKKKSRPIQGPPGHPFPLVGETRVQFHNRRPHLLVNHERQIAIYDGELECLHSWYPSVDVLITSAIYSCDGRLIITGFRDGAVGIFSAHRTSDDAFPVVIAAHPFDPNQFAVGMSNGGVHIIDSK